MLKTATPEQAERDVRRLLAILSDHEERVYDMLSDDALADLQMIELRWAHEPAPTTSKNEEHAKLRELSADAFAYWERCNVDALSRTMKKIDAALGPREWPADTDR